MSANNIIKAFAENPTWSTYHHISTLDPEGNLRFYISDGGKVDLGKGLDMTTQCFLQETTYPLYIEGNNGDEPLNAISADILMGKAKVSGLNFQNPLDEFVDCEVTTQGIAMMEMALYPNKYRSLVCAFISAIVDGKGYRHLQTMRSPRSIRLVKDYIYGTINPNNSFYIWMNKIDPADLTQKAYNIFTKYGCIFKDTNNPSFFGKIVGYFTGKNYVRREYKNEDPCQQYRVNGNNVVTKHVEENTLIIKSEGIGSIAAQTMDGCKVINITN